MLERVCEPIPEDPRLEAEKYLEMDNKEANHSFVADLMKHEIGPLVIDLGCGPAIIPILICEENDLVADGEEKPSVQVMAVDSCVEMLELARFELEMAGRVDQVQLQQIDLNDPEGLQTEIADTVISNTVLHHLENPATALGVAVHSMKQGARLFIRDLFRPETDAEIELLVAQHVDDSSNRDAYSPAQLLRQSLHAALTLAEIRESAAPIGIPSDCIQTTSDRHWTIDWQKP